MIIQTILAIQKTNLRLDIEIKAQTKVVPIQKKKYFNIEEKDETKTGKSKTKIKEFKIQKKAILDVSLRWNRDRESSFCKEYGKGSKYSIQKHQKLAQDFKRKTL